MLKELSASVWPLGRCTPSHLNQGQDHLCCRQGKGYKATKMLFYGQNLTGGSKKGAMF